jgi:hypothetical protein
MTRELTPSEVRGQRTIRNLYLTPLDSNHLVGHTCRQTDGTETFLGHLERDRRGHLESLFPLDITILSYPELMSNGLNALLGDALAG